MTAVYKKELRSYFTTMTGYIIIAFILLVGSAVCAFLNIMQGYPDFANSVLTASYSLLVAVPLLTMQSLAGERHLKTDSLLYSLPLSLGSVVIGKYLAMLTVFLIPTGIIAVYPLIFTGFGSVNLGSSYGAIAAFILLGAAMLSVGLFVSSLTDNQIISAILCVCVMLFMFFVSGLAGIVPAAPAASLFAFLAASAVLGVLVFIMTKNKIFSAVTAAAAALATVIFYFVNTASFENAFPKFMSALSITDRMEPFASGVFDVGSLVYYLTVTAVFLFFSVQSVEKRRWN